MSRRITVINPAAKTRAQLQEEVDQLQAENEELNEKLDSILEIVGVDEDEEEDEEDDEAA